MLTQPRDRDVQCHASAWHMDGKDDVRIKLCIRPTARGAAHDLPRARPRLLLPLVQGPAVPVPERRARRLPRGDRRHDQAVDDAGVPGADRPGAGVEDQPRSRDQPADEDGAGEDRVPAVRQDDRRVALAGVLGPGHAGELQRRVVGAAREVPGRRVRRWRAPRPTSTRAPSTTSPATRRTRATSCRSSCSSSSTRRCARRRATRARCRSARSTATRRPASEFGAMLAKGASQPWQDTLYELTGTRQMDASAILEYFAAAAAAGSSSRTRARSAAGSATRLRQVHRDLGISAEPRGGRSARPSSTFVLARRERISGTRQVPGTGCASTDTCTTNA